MSLSPPPDHRTCMFCGYRGPLTKEHIWGKWTLEFYPPPGAKPGHGHHKVSFRNEKAQVLYRDGLFARPGDPLAQTTKVVCGVCNSGWMSIVEDQMKAAFQRIFLDREEAITSQDIAAILKWGYLKTCLHFRALGHRHDEYESSVCRNHTELGEATVEARPTALHLRSLEAEDWSSFFKTKSVPADFRIVLARGCHPLNIGGVNLHYKDYLLDDVSKLKPSYLHFMSLGDMQLVATNWPEEIPQVASDLLRPPEQRFFAVLTPSTSEAHLPTDTCISAQVFDKIVAVFFTQKTAFKAPLTDDSYPDIP